MQNQKNNESEFKPLPEIITEFSEYNLCQKCDFLKKLTTTVSYNTVYQSLLCQQNFLLNIMEDLIQIMSNGHESEEIVLYAKLFFLLFHNLIIGNGSNQNIVFKSLFVNIENFNKIKTITLKFLKENKIKKYLLSIFYNIVLSNETNILLLTHSHLEYIITIFLSLNYEVNTKDLEDKDLNDINDFIHINLKHILINEILLLEKETTTICSYLLTSEVLQQRILFIELFRDYVDYSKDSKTLRIGKYNLQEICKQFSKNVEELNNLILDFESKEFKDIENYKMSDDDKIIYVCREFICYVDILSVFLVSDEFPEYLEIIHKEVNLTLIVKAFHYMLTTTDKVYEKIFKRNKLLNPQEAIGVPILSEMNFLYGFQTNIMKVLSNFAYKNEELKEKFLEDPVTFYYFLNHLKLDKCNPFKKEWTVLYIKAVTDGNTKVQNMIKELRPADMDPLLKDYILNKGNVSFVSKDDLMRMKKEQEEENEQSDEN